MATGTLGTAARDYHTRQRHYLSGNVTMSNIGAAATGASFKIGTVPGGSYLIGAFSAMTTAFNAGTNNNVSVGVTSGGSTLVPATAGLAVAGVTALAIPATAAAALAADTDIWVTGTFSGAAPTTGNGYVFVEYFVTP